MNKLNINRTTNRSIFINETGELQLTGKKKLETLQVHDAPGHTGNILRNNERSNEWKFHRERCRSPPFSIL
ncbi:hypothetical protein [Bacteroides sp.]|uniref:hypothetical protein n=1 Tax=Bacteroides sp. TaxID=29523 RepID=UPI002613B3BC|nr:hypothetical protein [Bacteroides sp.]MDD3038991.1 hypothetical protein [Bacteroides sp.]